MKKLFNLEIKFIFFGILNVILSNLFLQILLFLNFIPIDISTFIYIIFNALFGYLIYGKFVFRVVQIIKIKYMIKYSLSLLISWIILNTAIYQFLKINISPNISSIIMIPFLTSYSFLIQKFWIFKANSRR